MSDSVVVDGTYYKPRKVLLSDDTESDTTKIELFPDDYALMLNYFSRSSSDNWQRRENQLKEAIHADAKIFQIHFNQNIVYVLTAYISLRSAIF